jgi:hypothetical protein
MVFRRLAQGKMSRQGPWPCKRGSLCQFGWGKRPCGIMEWGEVTVNSFLSFRRPTGGDPFSAIHKISPFGRNDKLSLRNDRLSLRNDKLPLGMTSYRSICRPAFFSPLRSPGCCPQARCFPSGWRRYGRQPVEVCQPVGSGERRLSFTRLFSCSFQWAFLIVAMSISNCR